MQRKALIGTAAFVTAALAMVTLPRLFGSDGDDQTSAPPFPSSCQTPPRIRPVTLNGPDTWSDLAVPAESRCFSLVATRRDAAGVAPDSEFLLTSTEALDVASIPDRLQVDPPVELRITPERAEPGEAGRLRVAPASSLAADTVYRFTLLDRPGGAALDRWSFPATGALRVTQTLPADEATSVPLDVGIELTFSHDGAAGVQDRFSIDPPVEGRFETHRRTTVFVPKRLRAATLYTVTLRPGVSLPSTAQTITEPFVFRFETGTADRREPAPALRFSQELWESPVAERPVLGLYSGQPDGAAPGRLAVEVHRFADQQQFLASLDRLAAIPWWATLSRAAFAPPIGGIPTVARFDAPLEKAGPAGELAVRFPEALPAGAYLVRGEAGGRRTDAWLQVTDLSAYASVSEAKTVVWVNDVRAHGPVRDARVAVAGSDFSVATGADGVALFDTPPGLVGVAGDALGVRAGTARNLLVTASGGRTIVVPLSVTLGGAGAWAYREYDFAGSPDDHWRFLYSDRKLYRPNDTVHVWGLAKPRRGGAELKTVTVEVRGSDALGRPVLAARATLPLSPAGTFIGELALTGVSPGYYSLQVRAGEQTLASTAFEVRDFVKPAYSLAVVPSPRAVFAGDPVRYDITATFPEGTPVPGVRLKNTLGGDRVVEATTDAAGRASVQLPARSETYNGPFFTDPFSVTPAVPEEGEIVGGAEAVVFAGAVALEAEATRTGTEGVVSGTASRVDLAKAAAATREELWRGAYKAGPAAGQAVTVDVSETGYTRVETGEYYDFIAKQVRKTYRWDPYDLPVATHRVTTDRAGRFRFPFPAGADRSYRITVRASDDRGRTSQSETYLSSIFQYPEFTQLEEESQGPYRVGDEVTMALRRGTEVLPQGAPNRYLFVEAQNGIRGYATQDGPRRRVTFAEDDIPGVYFQAVRFTGTTYEEAPWPMLAAFDRDARRLQVEITTPEPKYRPREQVPLRLRVTDGSGQPVSGAEVLLSAVDERIFRLQESSWLESVDVLDQLYEPVASGVLGGYASHAVPGGDTGGGAEAGEGGEARSDFRDTPLFTRVTTGDDGRAEAAFAVPDDLTSWRVSALAVTGALAAGTGAALVPVGLPLFADVAMNSSYVVADRPVIRLRAFGEALAAKDPVSFTVESPSLLDRPLTAAGVAFSGVDIALPPLRPGRHEVTVRVAAKGKEDALTRTVTIVPSRLVQAQASVSELNAGAAWAPGGLTGAGPVIVVLTDHNRGRWYPDLVELAYTSGDRVDQALARELAAELLSRWYGDPPPLPSAFRAAAFQTDDGGIAVLPFADDDLEVTVRLASLAPERFGRQGLVRYLAGITDDPKETRERVIIALAGLAALGEPVLDDLQRAAGAEDLSVRERLHLGLGAAAAGDLDTARRLYRELLADHGQVRGEAIRLDVGRDLDDILEASSLAAILGAELADGLAPALETYVAGNLTKDILVALERISFLARAVPRLSADPVRLTYRFGGQLVEDELSDGESKALSLDTGGLAALDLRVTAGTLGVVRSSLVPLDPKAITPDPAVTVTRTLPERIGASDLVRITLDARLGSKAAGCYRLTDLLPSGLRVVSEPYRYGIRDRNLMYPYAVEGQRVSFCVQGPANPPVVYYARVIAPGSYVAEPAVAQSLRAPESIGLTGSVRVEIR